MGKYLLLGCMVLVLAGCARPDKIVTAPAGVGEKVIEMRVSSFSFEPNVIRAQPGDRLVLLVENISAMEHNITIISPSGETLVAQDLRGGGTVPITVTVSEPGDYLFHCDKPMHPRLGMRGRLEVR